MWPNPKDKKCPTCGKPILNMSVACRNHRPVKTRPLKDRFWEKVKITQDQSCWEWQASFNTGGYGQIMDGSIPYGGVRHLVASRVAWELTYGPIPEGKFVCHHCDNKKCVRPDHLYIGDDMTNNHDISIRERNLKTIKIPRSQRTDIQKVWDSTRKHRGLLITLAKQYHVSTRTIFDIVHRYKFYSR